MPVNSAGQLAPKTEEALIKYLTKKLTILEGRV
jgi:hypothetical protein